jgi:hypothetical protein
MTKYPIKSSIIIQPFHTSAVYNLGITSITGGGPGENEYFDISAIIIDSPNATTFVRIIEPTGSTIFQTASVVNISNSLITYNNGSLVRVPPGCQLQVVVGPAVSAPIVKIIGTKFANS